MVKTGDVALVRCAFELINAMRILRWALCFPGAMGASFMTWMFSAKMFSGVDVTYGGGFFRSLVGLVPLLISTAVPTIIFVFAGVFISPSSERSVCFVFFALSLVLSAGGIHMLMNQDGYLFFWLASVGGIVAGSFLGLVVALRLQRARKPITRLAPMGGTGM